jgi:tyrosyl-tRNA synthetase
MFGKVMSISDDLMWRYFELLSFRPLAEVEAMQGAVDEGGNPRDIKFELAKELVERFHDKSAAEREQAEFIARFQQGAMPQEITEVSVAGRDGKLGIGHLLRDAGLVSSTSEAFRMIRQGAVRIDGSKIDDRGLEIAAGTSQVYQVGKRKFARVSVT